jgi:hypothetical protein
MLGCRTCGCVQAQRDVSGGGARTASALAFHGLVGPGEEVGANFRPRAQGPKRSEAWGAIQLR